MNAMAAMLPHASAGSAQQQGRQSHITHKRTAAQIVEGIVKMQGGSINGKLRRPQPKLSWLLLVQQTGRESDWLVRDVSRAA
jgi:hypothetical protein